MVNLRQHSFTMNFHIASVFVLFCCLGQSLGQSASADQCGTFKKVGCFKKDEELFHELMITDLDPTHHKWGQDIDWGNFQKSMNSLACRCEAKVRGKYDYFAIGFYGECWGGSDNDKIKGRTWDTSDQCVGGNDFSKCDKSSKKECAGKEDNEFVYQVTTKQPSYTCKMKRGYGTSARKAITLNALLFNECRDKCIKLNNKKGVDTVDKGKIDGMSFNRALGCKCFYDMKRINEAAQYQRYRSCHLKMNNPKPNELEGNDGKPDDGLVDLSYTYWKDGQCETKYSKVGCFKASGRDRMLINYRYDIEWAPARISSFAQSLVCACAEAARLKNVEYFATHFWGECWEIDPEDIGPRDNSGCKVADGKYTNDCKTIMGADEECLGVGGYYIYTNTGGDRETGDNKKRSAA